MSAPLDFNVYLLRNYKKNGKFDVIWEDTPVDIKLLGSMPWDPKRWTRNKIPRELPPKPTGVKSE